MATSDLEQVELIKLKVQGKKRSLHEFKKRIKLNSDNLDIKLMNETPILPNMEKVEEGGKPKYFRQFLFIGMNRRKPDGEKKTKRNY